MKLLGREPTLYIAAVAAFLPILATFGFAWLTGDQANLWNAAIYALSGAATAFFVRPLAPAVFTYAIQTVVALFQGYGIGITDEQLVLLQSAAVPFLTLLTRAQVSPRTTGATKITTEPTPEASANNVARGLPAASPAPDVTDPPG